MKITIVIFLYQNIIFVYFVAIASERSLYKNNMKYALSALYQQTKFHKPSLDTVCDGRMQTLIFVVSAARISYLQRNNNDWLLTVHKPSFITLILTVSSYSKIQIYRTDGQSTLYLFSTPVSTGRILKPSSHS